MSGMGRVRGVAPRPRWRAVLLRRRPIRSRRQAVSRETASLRRRARAGSAACRAPRSGLPASLAHPACHPPADRARRGEAPAIHRTRARPSAPSGPPRRPSRRPRYEGRPGRFPRTRAAGLERGGVAGRGSGGSYRVPDQDAVAARASIAPSRCAVQFRVVTVHGARDPATVREVLWNPRSASTPAGSDRWLRAKE